jgi:hypothetical protein
VGPVGKKGRPPIGKVREWYVESRHLQGCSPRLYRLRTGELTPVSKYWTHRSHVGVMGPVCLVAGCQQKLVFSPLSHWLLWERSWVWTRGSDGRRAVDYVRSPFSRGQWICTNLLMTFTKGCYMLTTWDTYDRWPYADWAWEACGMLVGFSPAGCTLIQIIATLGYEFRLFAAVIT